MLYIIYIIFIYRHIYYIYIIKVYRYIYYRYDMCYTDSIYLAAPKDIDISAHHVTATGNRTHWPKRRP